MLRRLPVLYVLIAVGSGLCQAAMASESHAADGHADAGRAMAEQWCARCHDISVDGPFKQMPPSFAAIAVYRAEPEIRWRIQYPPQHGSMPAMGFVLDQAALDDLLAYILSLDAGLDR